MLEKGVNFAPSQFETSFMCKPFNEAIIDEVIEKANESFKEIIA